MADSMSSVVPRRGGDRMFRLLVAVGFGLMLGACSKCDMPTWHSSSTGMFPVACHEGPSPQ
jgi:hypothetical protein